MEKIRKQVREFIQSASIEEKIQLLTGASAWETRGYLSKNIPAIVMADGPHGVRKVISDLPGLGESYPATIFPSLALLASTWDVNLASKMGAAIGIEAKDQDVDILLAPGLNIKRTPLCGRNFEYFSEDPLLSGKMASAYVRGVQNVGVGATIKHYAANSQDNERLMSNSIVDERALREIYLRGFEIAVKESQPAMVMTCYNRVNGVYGSENTYLLDVLRKEWGYDGVVVSDWGGMNDPVLALKAGHDLEMPGNKLLYRNVHNAYLRGELSLSDIDNAVEHLVTLAIELGEERKMPKEEVDNKKQYEIAKEIATQGMVLLENNGVLPFTKEKSVGVIGAFAQFPRYQGGGSSQVNAKQVESLLSAFDLGEIKYEYADGYDVINCDKGDKLPLLIEAVEVAKRHEQVIVMVGLPESFEVEGLDRKHMRLPRCHLKLIAKLREVNPNIVVVVGAGSVVEMPWTGKVGATIMAYLAGAASGDALTDVIFGDVNPSGHLAETIPYFLEDTPSYRYLVDSEERNAQYRESIFVGYRYYENANVGVAFPFGHGLSYSTFKLSKMKLSKNTYKDKRDVINVSVEVENTSDIEGHVVVQLYVGQQEPVSFKPLKELRGFKKVKLKGGQTQTVKFILDRESFSYWHTLQKEWAIEDGKYTIYIGTSSANIHCKRQLTVNIGSEPEPLDYSNEAEIYHNIRPYDDGLKIDEATFKVIYGEELPIVPRKTKRPFTLNSPIIDAKQYWSGRLLIKIVTKVATALAKEQKTDIDTYLAGAIETPLRSLIPLSGGALNERQVEAILDIMNGKLLRGTFKFITKKRDK